MPCERPLPAAVADRLRPSPARAPVCSVLVVSHHLDGLLRSHGSRCIATRCQRGFAVFPGDRSCRPAEARCQETAAAVPHDAFRTLRRIPLVRSRTASLRPLPSCRLRTPSPGSSRPLCVAAEPVARHGRRHRRVRAPKSTTATMRLRASRPGCRSSPPAMHAKVQPPFPRLPESPKRSW